MFFLICSVLFYFILFFNFWTVFYITIWKFTHMADIIHFCVSDDVSQLLHM